MTHDIANDLWRLSAVELTQGIKNKVFSANEVLDAVLARIDHHNPRLNAIVEHLTDTARAGARESGRCCCAR